MASNHDSDTEEIARREWSKKGEREWSKKGEGSGRKKNSVCALFLEVELPKRGICKLLFNSREHAPFVIWSHYKAHLLDFILYYLSRGIDHTVCRSGRYDTLRNLRAICLTPGKYVNESPKSGFVPFFGRLTAENGDASASSSNRKHLFRWSSVDDTMYFVGAS